MEILKVKDFDIAFRQPIEDDINFIYNSWLKSNRNNETTVQIPNDVYYNNHKYVIQKILNRDGTLITVICNPKDVSQVFGYIVYEYVDTQPVVHYLYVKYTFRKLTLAKILLEKVIPSFGNNLTIVTHTSRNFSKYKDKNKLVYNPYYLHQIVSDANSSKGQE